ncbi:MAG: glycosyltransferase family 2 protein [Bacteriovoracaceae bacterium]|nr:glycosyltransferase family 2 protein [Bacteriovoracaceae bacterium]
MEWQVYPAAQGGTWVAVMPAYNEQAALAELVAEWHSVVTERGGELVLINDGSRDQTLATALALQANYPGLTVIDKSNSGHGDTCRRAYQWAAEQGKEWVFQTDSDRQTLPQEFALIWDQRGQHDFIFGRRKARGDGWMRKVISSVLRCVIAVIFQEWVPDANVPFRLMKTEKLAQVLPLISPQMFLGNAFLTIVIQKKFKIHWVPISFVNRQTGVPSVALGRFFKVGWRVTREFWQLRCKI